MRGRQADVPGAKLSQSSPMRSRRSFGARPAMSSVVMRDDIGRLRGSGERSRPKIEIGGQTSSCRNRPESGVNTHLIAYPSPTTSSTAFVFRSIPRSSTLAAGSGWRRPCSQPSRVRTGMPKRRENSREVFATLFRIAITRSAVSDATLRTGSAISPCFQAAASRGPSSGASPRAFPSCRRRLLPLFRNLFACRAESQ